MPTRGAGSEPGVARAITRSRGRSYPRFSLKKAVEYAHSFYDRESQGFVAPVVAITHFGFKATGRNNSEMSGHASTALSTLKQFALLEERDGKVGLTAIALDILVPSDELSRARAIREAAFSPPIYRDIWDNFQGKLPSDEAVKHFLERDRRIHPKALGGLMRDLKASLGYAEVVGDHGFEAGGVAAGSPPQGAEQRSMRATDPANSESHPPLAPRSTHKEYVYPLDEGPAVVRRPAELSEASDREFKSWLLFLSENGGRAGRPS
jgi:hypothetical protein